jgi:hypothetical protein
MSECFLPLIRLPMRIRKKTAWYQSGLQANLLAGNQVESTPTPYAGETWQEFQQVMCDRMSGVARTRARNFRVSWRSAAMYNLPVKLLQRMSIEADKFSSTETLTRMDTRT